MSAERFEPPAEVYLVQKFQNGGQAWFSYGAPTPCYIRYGNGDTIWLENGTVIQILDHAGLRYAPDQTGKWQVDRSSMIPEETLTERISCLD